MQRPRFLRGFLLKPELVSVRCMQASQVPEDPKVGLEVRT